MLIKKKAVLRGCRVRMQAPQKSARNWKPKWDWNDKKEICSFEIITGHPIGQGGLQAERWFPVHTWVPLIHLHLPDPGGKTKQEYFLW